MNSSDRTYLDVPFSEKDAAKANGARWDPHARRWYAPGGITEGLRPWAPAPELPTRLPGEDRGFGAGIGPELVPSTAWFSNVRSAVAERDWERIRRMVTTRAGGRCECCGAVGDRGAGRFIECDERWDYQIAPGAAVGVQRLRRLMAACTPCHRVRHFGLAEIRGHREEALAQFMTMAGIDRAEAETRVAAAFELWRQRSEHTWPLDVSILSDAGVLVAAPPDADTRAAQASEGVAEQWDGPPGPFGGCCDVGPEGGGVSVRPIYAHEWQARFGGLEPDEWDRRYGGGEVWQGRLAQADREASDPGAARPGRGDGGDRGSGWWRRMRGRR